MKKASTTCLFLSNYCLHSDFHLYEIGDVVTLGTKDIRYFYIPKTKLDMVAKIKLATKDLYNYYLKQNSIINYVVFSLNIINNHKIK